MKQVPAKWDDLKLIDGFPGKFVVMARKSGDLWYLAGINAQTEILKLNLDVSVLNLNLPPTQSRKLTLITDGENNRSFVEKHVTLNENKLEVEIKPNGGFVVVL
ncbi:MAG: glycoside hydrolase family 97 C-terminal domain-containing protein [Paludibacter sp.]|nr:glycoside hydrolase family 97 C-terminal domain-containing protein [Paludibacter sp.]